MDQAIDSIDSQRGDDPKSGPVQGGIRASQRWPRGRKARYRSQLMGIDRLDLSDFRNHGTARLSPERPMIVLTGDNGAGKTNILEAVSLLAPGRGLRGAPLRDMARQDGPGSLQLNATGGVLSYIRVADTSDTTLAALRAAGVQIVHVAPAYRVVTAYVEPAQMASLAALSQVANVQEALRPDAGAASVRATSGAHTAQAACAPGIVSEGDAQLKAVDARTAFPIDGAGVTVGVLSDSFDRATDTPTHAANDIAAGELPGAGNPCGRTTPVNVIAESSDQSGNSDEGRAMVQIVHDLAPGANLAFATANGGVFAFADNIRALQQAGASVIVDDISYFIEPFYQDGPVSVAIQDVISRGAMYFTSAGNSNGVDQAGNLIASYEAPYRPTPCPDVVAGFGVDCQSFNPAGDDATFGMAVAPGGGFTMVFQWAQPWGGVETDLDIIVLNANGVPIAGSLDTNNADGSQRPMEAFSYVNRTGDVEIVYLLIGRPSGPPTGALKYVMLRSAGILATEYNATNSSDTFGPTVVGHSMANSALSVGAIPFNDAESPETFSSRGPATVYFGPTLDANPAAVLSAPETRQKPDFAATDGNQNNFFGEPDGSIFRFFGTSSAAPHAAAVAALMRQRANQRGVVLSQYNGEAILESTASPMANGVPLNVGAGRINAANAVYGVEQIVPQTPAQYLPLVIK